MREIAILVHIFMFALNLTLFAGLEKCADCNQRFSM